MSFRRERRQLRDRLRPGEEILASDVLCAIKERPELTVLSHPVLVVTSMGVYLVLSGKEKEVRSVDFDVLAAVERTDDPVPGSTLRLILNDGEVLTFDYEPRAYTQATADVITKRFFGRIVKDTTAETPPSDT
jgi:hypothetical protein